MFGGINVPFIPFLSLTVVNTVHLTPRSQYIVLYGRITRVKFLIWIKSNVELH